MDQAFDLVKEFGVSTAFLAALLYGLRQLGMWLAEHVVKPIVTTHIEYMKQSILIQQKMGETQDTMGKALTRIEINQAELRSLLKGD